MGLFVIFSLLINIHFRDLFLQQRSLILGEVDIRGRKRLLETKECESGRKLRKRIRQEIQWKSKHWRSGRLQQFEESLSWDEHKAALQLSQFKIMKFLDLTGCRA